MYQYTVDDLKRIIEQNVKIIGKAGNRFFTNLKSIEDAGVDSLVWCNPGQKDKQQLVENTRAGMVICDHSIKISEAMKKEKCFIVVGNPKNAFTRIARELFVSKPVFGIDPSAVIHPEAEIDKETYIGPLCYVGKCRIDRGTLIYGQCFIHDEVEIGKNVVIEVGCVIGSEGFGLSRNREGAWERFPHVGNVVIEDHVEIGARSSVDRGGLGSTRIGKGTKISKSVHIAHNVVIGKNCIITGGALISGSVHMGDDVWVGPNATILNKIHIGNDVFISIGAVVTRNVQDNYSVIGNRILPGKDFIRNKTEE